MAVAFVGSTVYANGGATSTAVNLNKPAGLAVGDLMAAYVVYRNKYVSAAPAGWSLLLDTGNGLAVYTRTATGSEPAGWSWTIDASGGAGYNSGALVAYRGVQYLGANAKSSGSATAGAFAAPSVNATGGETLLCGWFIDRNALGTSTITPPGDMTERADPAGSVVGLGVADRIVSGSGATGTKTATLNVSSSAGAGAISLLLVGNVAPNAPTLTAPANAATIDRSTVQRFAWQFSDPDAGDSQSKFDLQYRIVGAATWTTVSGTTPNALYDFAAGTFAAGNYEWQVRTYDSRGVVGPWSSSSFFTAATAPAQPTITAPVNGATVNNTATLTWSAPNQTDYQWRRVKDNAGSADTSTIYQDSGDEVDSTTRSVTLTFDTNNRYEHIQVRIKNAGLWSSWADARVQVSFTPPTTATFTMAADPTAATRTLTITNPAPGSGVPATSYNDVYVRTAASSTVLDTYRPYSATGTRIGTQLATNTAFVDRAPAGSPVVYEYRVVSVASNQATSDSGWVSTA